MSYAILRPAVLFGREDILINNIAWTLRKLPVFGVFGDGQYRLQPIYVDDLVEIAVEQGESREAIIILALHHFYRNKLIVQFFIYLTIKV